MTTSQHLADRAALDQLVFMSSSEGIMIFESIRDDVGVIVDLRHVDANPAALTIVQRPHEELVGNLLSKTFPGNFETGIFTHYKRALETGTKDSFEIHYRHEGLDHWFDVSSNPVGADLIIITFVDVSRIKRASALLARQEEELRFILDAVPARIWYKDDKNTILRLNQAAADAMGMSVEEAEGANAYDLFPLLADDYHRDDLEALDGMEPMLGIVERFAPKSGQQGWISTDKIPLADSAGDDRRLLVVSTDITRLIAAEEELRLANESLSHFASIAAHDLQAPLRQIGMLSDLLKEELGDSDKEGKAGTVVAQIQATSKRLRMLVTRLLDFSKVGTHALKLTGVALEDILEASLGEVGLDKAEIATVELDLDEPSHVFGDPILLTQVFTNLFQNSLKYGPKEDLRLTISSKVSKGLCTVTVWNNGEKIDPDFSERIFEVFSRLEDSPKVDGAGIGLAFCRKVITRHGGNIWLDSDNREGARFVLTLPSYAKSTGMTGPVQ